MLMTIIEVQKNYAVRVKPGNPAKCYNKINTGNTAFIVILFFKNN